MRILVLGAAGAMAVTIIRDLMNSEEIEKIIVSDMNDDALKRRVNSLSDKRIQSVCLDINDIDKVSKTMTNVDVTINSAYYETNLLAMQAAVKAKTPLIDLGGLYYMTKKQMGMNKIVKDSKTLVIPGIGSDPGTSNILCRHGSNKLDIVDEIHIRYGSTFSGLTFAFAAGTIIGEAAENAIIYENGKFIEIPPLSDEENTLFKSPVGMLKTCSILHSELATIPKSIKGVKKVTYKDSWDSEVLHNVKILNSLGLLSSKKLSYKNSEIVPMNFVTEVLSEKAKDDKPGKGWDCLQVTVKGKIGKKEVTYIFDVVSNGDKKAGITPTSYLTGTPPAIVARMIANNQVKGEGVLPPEVCIDPETYLGELRKRKIETFETKVETAKI